MIEHPLIKFYRADGYPPHEDKYPRCPLCNEECSVVYKNAYEVVGCDVCVFSSDAWDEEECFEQE